MSEAKLPKVVVEQTEPAEAPDADDVALTKVIVEDEAAQDEDAEELVSDGVMTDEGALEEDEQESVAAEEAEDAAEEAAPEVEEPVQEETVAREEPAASAEMPKPSPKVAAAPASPKPAEPPVLNPWLHRQFPGHEHAVVGCLVGLFFALVVLYVGIPRGLFIVACMAVGMFVGMYFDGDSRLTGAVRALRGKK
jgi:uncharacterized membrane protein